MNRCCAEGTLFFTKSVRAANVPSFLPCTNMASSASERYFAMDSEMAGARIITNERYVASLKQHFNHSLRLFLVREKVAISLPPPTCELGACQARLTGF